jgi:hypothetical protein
MNKKIVAIAVVLLLLGWTGSLLAETSDLHSSIGTEYSTKNVWRGFTVYGSKSTTHPFIDLDLYGSGFGLNVTGHIPNGSGEAGGLGVQQFQRWDYTLYYHNQLFSDQTYATNYMLGYVYYNYPHLSISNGKFPNGIDLQELHGALSFPKILGVEGLVPTYVLVKLWPSNSDSWVGDKSPAGGTASGFAHIFMLDYALRTTCPITNQERVINLHSEVVYNDGVGPAGQNVDHDWSDAVFGVSTDIDLGSNLIFTPGLFHQVTMDKSVNDEKSITWASLILKYKF